MSSQSQVERDVEQPPSLAVGRHVGRAAELSTLTTALDRGPALVTIEGGAGVGKSRLLREAFRPGGEDLDDRVLITSCQPFREVLTLSPFINAISRREPDLASLSLSALGGSLRSILPELADELPPMLPASADPTIGRQLLMRAMAELIDRMGIDVLVVEDVHWADESTLDLLLLLASREADGPDLVLTYRRDELAADSAVLRLPARRAAQMAHRRIELQPLTIRSTSELIASMLQGNQVDADFAAFVHAGTDGLPLAVEECIRLMHERSELAVGRNGWASRAPTRIVVPSTIRDAVSMRVAGLAPDVQAVLRAAAVATEPRPLALLGQIAELDEPRSARAADEAVRVGLLREDADGQIGFGHALSAQAVYDAVAAPDLRELHLRWARTLQAVPGISVATLARHSRAGGDIPAWVRYSELAADSALAARDLATAVTFFQSLLLDPRAQPGAAARVARKLPIDAVAERCEASVVMAALRMALQDAALPASEAAEVRRQLARFLFAEGRWAEGAAEMERALDGLSGDPEGACEAMTFLGQPTFTRSTRAVHTQWLHRAAALTPDLPPQQRLARLVDQAHAMVELGDQQGWSWAADLPTAAAGALDRFQLARAALNLGNACIHWGRFEQARVRLAAATQLAQTEGLDRLLVLITLTESQLDFHAARWSGLAERVGAFVTGDNSVFDMTARLTSGLLELTTATDGGPGLLELRHVLQECLKGGLLELVWESAAAVARAELAAGAVEAAVAVTDGPMSIIESKQIWLWAVDLAPVRVEALTRAGRRPEAERLVAAMEQEVAATGGAIATLTASVLGAQAILAQHLAGTTSELTSVRAWSAAALAWDRAAAAWDVMPRPYDALLARERQGNCLLAAGQQGEALSLLGTVASDLAALGAVPAADRVVATLRTNGMANARRSWRGGTRGYGTDLSPRELLVVQLVMTGRTNAQIAEQLGRSKNTVAVQLNSAMRKLGVGTRTMLALAAADLGVAPASF